MSELSMAPPYVWGILVSVAACFAVLGHMSSRLKMVRPEIWERLNLQWPHREPSTAILFRTILFTFGREYRQLNDPSLTRLVWVSRAVIGLAVILLVTSAAWR